MSTTSFLEQSHDINGCNRNRIQELAEQCDHEYYMSALPIVTNKERAMRGRSRIIDAIEELRHLLEITECKSCRDEIESQIMHRKKDMREIETVWNA